MDGNSQKDPSKGNKKKGKAKKDSEPEALDVYPEKFSAHIHAAQTWLDMHRSNRTLTQDDRDFLTFEHNTLGPVYYSLMNKDVLELHHYVQKKDYTLCVIDIPYGFDMAQCLHNDKVQWGTSQHKAVLQAFKVVSTARLWRIVVHHSMDQYTDVAKVLTEECSGGIQNCMW